MKTVVMTMLALMLSAPAFCDPGDSAHEQLDRIALPGTGQLPLTLEFPDPVPVESDVSQPLEHVQLCYRTLNEPGLPRFLCEYKDVPKTKEGQDREELETLVRGTVCVTKSSRGYEIRQVEILRAHHAVRRDRDRLRAHPQIAFFSRTEVEERPDRFRLVQEATAFAAYAQRATDFKLEWRTMTGTIRMRFYNGGRFLSKPYSDKTHPIACKRIDAFPPDAPVSLP